MQIRANFSNSDVAVIGLHTVFEHHDAQGSRAALAAFLNEYRISFPVGIDQPSDTGRLPLTMRAYQMQGTPSLILIDRQGRLRKNQFGRENDMRLGAEIMALIGEEQVVLSTSPASGGSAHSGACTQDHCSVD